MNNPYVKLDTWAIDILADPLSKDALTLNEDGTFLFSSYGRRYPVKNGICDLRLLNNETSGDQKIWKEGQREYERWAIDLGEHDKRHNYQAEINGVKEVYDDIPLEGRCLDIGGSQGRVRHFLNHNQQYMDCDPFIDIFDGIGEQPNLLKAYPFLSEPVNFVCCDAEFLPFTSGSFQTVHMRSVIDHFLSPELALNEAYRVLGKNGILIVGLYVEGGRTGKMGTKQLIKKNIRELLVKAGMKRFKDYHVWHPTYQDLCNLITTCGFEIEKTHWQKGYGQNVCYIKGRKKDGLIKKA